MGIQQGQYTLLWKLTSVRSHHLSQGFNPFSPPMAPLPCFKSPWTPAWITSIFAKVAPCVCPTAVIMIAPRKIMLKWSQIMCPTLPISLREKSKSWHWCIEVQAQSLWNYLHYSVPTTGHLLCLPLVGLLFPQKTTSQTGCPCLTRVFTHFLIYYLWWLILRVNVTRLQYPVVGSNHSHDIAIKVFLRCY